MATKSKNPRREDLDRLQKRLNQGRRNSETKDQDTILTYLVQNLDSQRLLAKWQDLLRNEQGVLLNRIQDQRSRVRAQK